jgi:hypothetical protein
MFARPTSSGDDAPAYFFLDETGFDERSTHAAVTCIVLENPTPIRRSIKSLQDVLLRDPCLKAHRQAMRRLSEKGFHHTDDHFDVRARFMDLISGMPFQAYVCFVEKAAPFDARAWHDRLLGRLLFERLRANRRRRIEICFEQTDTRHARRLREVQAIVSACMGAISHDRGGAPFEPGLRCAGKEEPCLSIADYVGAIVRTYLDERHDPTKTSSTVQLYRLQPKLRVIHDYGRDTFFTRHNPLVPRIA